MSSAFIMLPSLTCLQIMFKVVNTIHIKLVKVSPVTELKKEREKKDELNKEEK